MQPLKGCAECTKTNKHLNQYSFYNLLGQQFVLFVCNDCIMGLSDRIKSLSAGEQVTYLTDLGQIISKSR